MSPARRPPDRRTFLAGGVALLLAGCRGVTAPAPSPTASERSRPAPSPDDAPDVIQATVRPMASLDLPDVTPWTPSSGEVEPEVKIVASRLLEALGTAPVDSTPADRLRAVGADPRLSEDAGPLVPPATPAVAEIVYPQYGGLTADSASIMAVTRQWWVEDGDVRSRTVTADVRLTRDGGQWSGTDLHPVPAADVRGLTLPDAAERLRDLPGIDLPPAAFADAADGLVDSVVLDALVELAGEFDFSVCVLRSGHPENVFGTDRTSNHTRGRAADIWAVDGRPVVGMGSDDATLLSFFEAIRAVGSDEIGGPFDPDGPGGVHFTDQVHRDHVHIGFRVD